MSMLEIEIRKIVREEIKKIKFDSSGNPTNIFIDIFGNECFYPNITRDHICSKHRGGSDIDLNKLYMCRQSNSKKGHKNKGKINNIKFGVIINKDKKKNTFGKLWISDPKNIVDTTLENKRCETFLSSLNNNVNKDFIKR